MQATVRNERNDGRSSLARPPKGASRIWPAALGLVLAWFVGSEFLWRAQGFLPHVPDDDLTWARSRSRLGDDGIVLIGSSRLQAAIDPHAWDGAGRSRLPAQLAMPGGSPLPVLEHVAFETDFSGLAVVDVVPGFIFDRAGEGEALAEARIADWEERSTSPGQRIEAEIRAALRERFVTLRLSPLEFASRSFVRKRPGRILYFSMTADRFLRLDFSLANLSRRVDQTLADLERRGDAVDVAERDRLIERFAAAGRALRDRGGELVLIRMPVGGAVAEIEHRSYPRKLFWDRLVEQGGAKAIHFADTPLMGDFTCPDGSHIDYAETGRFTRALARELAQLGASL